MKHIITIFTLALLSLLLVACGATPAPSSSAPEPTSSSASAASAAPAPLRPAQQAIADDYEQVLERYNTAVDAFNADANLSSMEDLVEIGNAVTAAFDEITPMMDSVATFTDEDIKTVRSWIADATEYIDILEGLVANYAGKGSLVTLPVELTNETGVDIQKLFMAPQSDTSWGNNLLDAPFKTGETVTTSMMITDDYKIWDLQATDSSENSLEFYGLDFSNINSEEPIEVTFGTAKDGSYTLVMGSGAQQAEPAPALAATPAPAPATPKPSSSSAPSVASSKPAESSSSTASSNENKKIVSAELDEVPDVTYEIGAGFRASDIKFRCRYSDGSSAKISTDKLTITANGVSISNGYKFKQAGTKKIVIKYKDWVVDYSLEVVSNVTDKKVDYCELYKEAQTLTYKVGGGFRANEIVVRCHYTDGTYEDFGHQNIEFYVHSTQLKNGYKFKEAGEKTVKMKFMDYSGSFKITVTK